MLFCLRGKKEKEGKSMWWGWWKGRKSDEFSLCRVKMFIEIRRQTDIERQRDYYFFDDGGEGGRGGGGGGR